MENSYILDSDDNVGYLRIEIPRNVADELEKGNLFLSGHVSAKGANFRVHMERGREHLEWSLEDASSLLESEAAVLTPEGGPSPVSPSPKAKGKQPVYSPRNSYIPPYKQPKKTVHQVEMELREKIGLPRQPELISMDWNTARHAVETKGLNWNRKAGILNQHPSDSLVKQDFYRENDEDFAARCFYVASNLGNERAVARISSQGRLTIPGATSLLDWWGKASSFQKLLLLTQQKKIDIHKVNHTRLTLIGCPFGDADLGEDSD